jgi:hypothetical protein
LTDIILLIEVDMSHAPDTSSKGCSAKNKSQRASLECFPLLPSEDAAEFRSFYLKIIKAIKPADFIEERWAFEYTKLDWQEMRLERFKHEYLETTIRFGLSSLALLHPKFQSEESFFDGWILRDPEARARFNTLLGQSNLTEEAVHALTYVAKIKEIEGIERRIEAIAKRRSRVMLEIERRREFFAQRLREASEVEKSCLNKLNTQEICEAAE